MIEIVFIYLAQAWPVAFVWDFALTFIYDNIFLSFIMGDTRTFRKKDVALEQYFSSLANAYPTIFRDFSVVIVGRLRDGTFMPSLYYAENRILHDAARMASVYDGEVIVYFVRDKKTVRRPASSIGDLFFERQADGIFGDSSPEEN